MSLVAFNNASLALGGRPIIDGLSLQINDQDRIGLIGPNGAGKTTLLRLLAGEQTLDGGTIDARKGLRIGYLPQDVSVTADAPLIEFMVQSVPGRSQLTESLAQAETALHEAEKRDDHDAMVEEATTVGELHTEIAHFEAHYSEHEAKSILAGLGFSNNDHDRPLTELSGGWKMRAVLASLLFQRPDLLLLDEPTNHLDMPSVSWFSAFLKRYERSFVLISHDREFLNEQIARVVSFEPEGVRSYRGDYEQYRRQRDEERVLLQNRAKNLQREREHLEQFIRRFRAKASKAAQVQSRVRALEKMDKVELHQDRQAISFRFPPSARSGKEVLRVEELHKAYGDLRVLEGVNLTVQRGDHIALIGVNGAGKTTLLKTLAGEIEPTSGGFEFGHKTKIGYYAQHHTELLDPNRTVYEEAAHHSKDGGATTIRTVLGAMLFGEDAIDKKIGVLSGGERARVSLAKLLLDPGNVLLMDEPTNHLDLESSERLAEALRTYDGTLLFVSHNRAFIRALATKIWIVADGQVQTYPGTLDDYLWSSGSKGEATAAVAETATPTKKKRKKPGRTEGKSQRRKEAGERTARRAKLGPVQKRSKELERKIGKLEKEQAERSAALSDPTVYSDAVTRDGLLSEVQRAQAELDVANEAWLEVLEELEGASKED